MSASIAVSESQRGYVTRSANNQTIPRFYVHISYRHAMTSERAAPLTALTVVVPSTPATRYGHTLASNLQGHPGLEIIMGINHGKSSPPFVALHRATAVTRVPYPI